jgi:hypothetical protein
MEEVKLKLPCVIKDHNSKTAIVVRAGRKYLYIVAMKSGKLTVTKQTFSQFERNDYRLMDIDVKGVVDKYLAHSGGHTDTARTELEEVRKDFIS